MKIKEIMIRNVKSIPANISVIEAFKILAEMQISGLPVIDENEKLCGMFTEKDILKTILPSYIETVGKFVYVENPKGISAKILELINLKVKDIMRKEVVTVDEDTAICEVARIMITQKIRRIPVVNKENKVIGIVARQDVLRALLKDYIK
ncbi:MAG: CBS domain-containing protein [Candidatus Omnitrophica bacterium]|nr:CBS domain-containing protein [Candidatus Omnitrophota bacterium]